MEDSARFLLLEFAAGATIGAFGVAMRLATGGAPDFGSLKMPIEGPRDARLPWLSGEDPVSDGSIQISNGTACAISAMVTPFSRAVLCKLECELIQAIGESRTVCMSFFIAPKASKLPCFDINSFAGLAYLRLNGGALDKPEFSSLGRLKEGDLGLAGNAGNLGEVDCV